MTPAERRVPPMRLRARAGHSLRSIGTGLLARWPVRPLVARRRLAALAEALAAGLPRVLEEPLRLLATSETPEEARGVEASVEDARRLLAGQSLSPFGWLSSRATPMASIASVDRLNGIFLHLCARAVGAETICEVGTAAGISGSYLALAPSCRRLYGLEGSAARLDLARATFAACGIEAKVCLILGAFEETLPRLVAQDVRIDLAYIDGDHRRQPTLDVFETLLGQLRPGAMVIFDDIRWSAEMFETWLELREWRGFSDTVDVGRMGLGIWTGTEEQTRVWDLARRLAWPKPVRVVDRAHLGES